MSYYILNFLQQVKKQFVLIFFLYLGLYIILFLMSLGLNLDLPIFNMMIGCPKYDDMIKILWTIFQISCHIYITFSFFSYEQDSSFEFLLLRESYKNSFLKKFFLIIFITIFIRLIIFFGTYVFFCNNITFPWISFTFNISIYITVSVITSLAFIFVKRE